MKSRKSDRRASAHIRQESAADREARLPSDREYLMRGITEPLPVEISDVSQALTMCLRLVDRIEAVVCTCLTADAGVGLDLLPKVTSFRECLQRSLIESLTEGATYFAAQSLANDQKKPDAQEASDRALIHRHAN
jgi:hypothetical protein